MKNLISVLILSFVMFSANNIQAQKNNFSDQEIAYIKTEFNKGMASFVESVKPIYKRGMSYSSFKTALIGSHSSSLKTQGDDLLKSAYNYLANSKTRDYIVENDSGKEIAGALKFIYEYDQSTQTNKGNKVLFGNNTNDSFSSDNILPKADGCLWWQLGCILTTIIHWISENQQEIIDAIYIICQIIGC